MGEVDNPKLKVSGKVSYKGLALYSSLWLLEDTGDDMQRSLSTESLK